MVKNSISVITAKIAYFHKRGRQKKSGEGNSSPLILFSLFYSQNALGSRNHRIGDISDIDEEQNGTLPTLQSSFGA